MITLYDYELSGNCYKIRLFLNILGLFYKTEQVDFFPAKEHKSEAFLRINPLGQLPAVIDDEVTLRDAQAILSYLAVKYDRSGQWYPTIEPRIFGQCAMWLAFGETLTASLCAARLHDVFFYDLDADACRVAGYKALRILDDHLSLQLRDGRSWLCDSAHPTIADIACFPYVMLSDEAGVSLMDFPSLRVWTDAVKRIPGFIVMSGIFPASPAIRN